MMTRDMEETIRQIVREEIALDEMRRIAPVPQERSTRRSSLAVPGIMPTIPGTVFFGENRDDAAQ